MGLGKFTGEVVKEGKKVRWPKRDVLIPSIIVVIVIALFFALILYLEDLLGAKIISVLKETFENMGIHAPTTGSSSDSATDEETVDAAITMIKLFVERIGIR